VTADEKAEKLEAAMETLQTRFARLFAEFTNNQKKLNDRIKYLEKQLEKYKTIAATAKGQGMTLAVDDNLSRFGSRMSRLSIVPPISDQLTIPKNSL
jgi:ABC-type enterochelin transport system substrate-binding protein